MTIQADSIPWLAPCRARVETWLDSGRFPHALLVHGPAGTARRQLAGWIARRRLGATGSTTTADGGLPAWAPFHPDLMVLVPEENRRVIRVEQIRELIAFLNLTSHQGTAKAAIIAPAEAMGISSANALLKTLEEPAGPSLLILVASAPSRLPATIVSRCQQIRVPRPDPAEAVAWLRQVAGDSPAWPGLLELAGGGPLRALELKEAGAEDLPGRLAAGLEGLVAGRESPVAVARSWAKEDPALVINALYLDLARRLRAGLGAGAAAAAVGNARLQIGRRTVTMTAGFTHLDRLLQARRRLDWSLNAELQLADLLMWWFGAVRPASAR